MQIGDKVSFGKHIWRVLDIRESSALIMTENIIETRSYHDRYAKTTWANCALRQYLNNEFYNQFTEYEKMQIVPIINQNPNNQWYGTDGGRDTQDNIFLLSLEEATCKYFGDSSVKLYNRNPKHKYWFQSKDENNHKRGTTFKGHKNSYWLRTPGRIGEKAVYIKGNGCVGIQGNNVLEGNVSERDYFGGVRPVLWLRITD